MPNGNEQAELREIVHRARQLYHRKQLCEADFRALVTHAMALDIKITLDQAFDRVNQDVCDALYMDKERDKGHHFVGVNQ